MVDDPFVVVEGPRDEVDDGFPEVALTVLGPLVGPLVLVPPAPDAFWKRSVVSFVHPQTTTSQSKQARFIGESWHGPGKTKGRTQRLRSEVANPAQGSS